MKKILITGANSYVGTSVEKWLLKTPGEFEVDTVDTMNEAWKKADFTKYDAVFHVAGIAHVDPKPEMAPLYYKVNRDLTVEIAKWAKFYPQNRELSDTVEIVRFFAKKYHHKVWISKLFNPAVLIGSWFLPQVPKMFADSYYEPGMTKYDFDYQVFSLEESMKDLEVTEDNRRMK